MKMFTGDNKVIKKEIEELIKLIEKTKIRSLPIYQTAETLIYFYELLTGLKTGYFRRLIKEDYSIIEKKELILENRKNHNIISTREIHEELIAFLNTYLDEVDYLSKQEDYFGNKIFDEEEMYEIIQDFFMSHNKNAATVFDFLIKEKRIFKMPNKEELDKAYSLRNPYKNNFYIFVKEGNNVVTTMTNIVHEMGHTMDGMQLLCSRKREKCNYYTGKSLFIEVISIMYEKKFIDFLLEEGVYKEYAEQEKLDFFSSLGGDLQETELLFYFPNYLLERNQYKRVSNQDFMNYLEDVWSITVNLDAMFHPRDIDLASNLEYCYGYVLSSYFSYLKDHDYSRYQESFHNFLELRTDYFPSDFFERIGTTSQELAYIVRDDCEEFTSKRIVKK